MSPGQMGPFHFGPAEKRLFGCYHGPQGEPVRDCGVVLCYPLGQEYVCSHRAYRQLAVNLARAGFPVLRFDFYGCGDSGGGCGEGEIRQWLADISAAIGEIRTRCDAEGICLAGLRLGASLAGLFGAERGEVESLVLWDPIVTGSTYVDELLATHRETLGFAGPEAGAGGLTEALGFPLPDSLRADLDRLSLLTPQRTPADHILLIESEEEDDTCLEERLKSLGARLTYQRVSHSRIWLQNPAQATVPGQVLRSIVSWLSGLHS